MKKVRVVIDFPYYWMEDLKEDFGTGKEEDILNHLKMTFDLMVKKEALDSGTKVSIAVVEEETKSEINDSDT